MALLDRLVAAQEPSRCILVVSDLSQCGLPIARALSSSSALSAFPTEEVRTDAVEPNGKRNYLILDATARLFIEPHSFIKQLSTSLRHPSTERIVLHLFETDPEWTRKLQWYATTVVRIRHATQPPCHNVLEIPLDANDPVQGIAEIFHRKRTGRTVREVDAYRVDKSTAPLRISATIFREDHDLEENNENPSNSGSTCQQAQPVSTFNLGLTEAQRIQREKAPLPFEKAKDERLPGVIEYHPDANDDFDSEDPDADLDI